MTLEIPNHSLLKKLDEGAMGEVWLGEHTIQQRRAAIKVLKATAHASEDLVQLFLRECQVLARFDHPNIVRIYDSGFLADGRAYLVMEFLAGGTLLSRLKQGPVTVGETLALVVQVAAGLGVAHRHKLVHRDLKPANVMLRGDGTPVLTDFGAARQLDRSTIYGKEGGIIGTPLYMSPEQISGKPLDGRSDLYALGVLFQELLTGRLPFPGASFEEIGSQHLFAPHPPLPATLVMLQPVVDRLLAKSPEQRYSCAEDFIDALRSLYVNDSALRLQVGYAGTGMAWSSQLRALGFVLNSGQTQAVRVAQALALTEQGHTAPVPPIAPLHAHPTTPNKAATATAPPLTAPSAERANAQTVGDHTAAVPGSRGAARSGFGAATALIAGLLVIALLGVAVWLWPRAEPASEQVQVIPEVPAAPSVSLSAALEARDAYISLRSRLEALAKEQQRDQGDVLKQTAETALDAQRALDGGRHAEALDLYLRARRDLLAAGRVMLDELGEGFRSAGERALQAGLLVEAQRALDHGKRIVAERANWVE